MCRFQVESRNLCYLGNHYSCIIINNTFNQMFFAFKWYEIYNTCLILNKELCALQQKLFFSQIYSTMAYI